MIKIEERGYAAHFCDVRNCGYVRNTLIELNFTRIIISSIGNYRISNYDNTAQKINSCSYYETKVFEAYYDEPYWEADVKKILAEYNKITTGILRVSDFAVDKFHNNVIFCISTNYNAGKLQNINNLKHILDMDNDG